jgi:hypothetical protein
MGSVPGLVGPQTAFDISGGFGGVPVLRQILILTPRLPQPFHPQVVPLLNVSRFATVNPFRAAIAAHQSPLLTWYVKHAPLGSGLGVISGSVPAEQQALPSGMSEEQKAGEGLYVVKAAPVIPQRAASVAQLSPATIETVLQSARGCRCRAIRVSFVGGFKSAVDSQMLTSPCSPVIDRWLTHFASVHDRTAACTVARFPVVSTTIPKIWFTLRPSPHSCMTIFSGDSAAPICCRNGLVRDFTLVLANEEPI